MTDSSVTLADGTTLPVYFVVLAHGYGSGNLPGGTPTDTADSASFKTKLKEKQAAIREAQTILIVGGGSVGVELSGEIKSFYPGKTMKMVHSQSSLLSNSQPPLIEAALEQVNSQMEALDIEVTLGTRLSEMSTPKNIKLQAAGKKKVPYKPATESVKNFFRLGRRRALQRWTSRRWAPRQFI